MKTRSEIRFLLNGEDVILRDVGASETLLDWLRIGRRLTGTKEGCAEGDCGACTVLVGRLCGDALRYEPLNACIRLLPSVDGCHIVTVEGVAGADGGLHPVQRALVEHHGSQCGFCTPGIVMALYALWMETPSPTVAEAETALQGNLCRCTGYAPIIRAAMAAGGDATADPLNTERTRVTARLAALRDGARVETGPEENRAFLPASVDDFAALYAARPEATVVAGATDVGLWVTKHLRDISPAIFIGHLEEMHAVVAETEALTIGAGASYAECAPALAEAFPHLAPYWLRIGGAQVRGAGTVGGNIANGSPIGDTPPVLIALGAAIVLRRGEARRRMALEDFFVEYGEQDRAPGEFVESIHVPRGEAHTLHAAYKISKRRDEDISSVAAGFAVTVEHGAITAARLAFGGMAGVPKRAAGAEAALVGRAFGAEAFEAAAIALADDFTPLSDWRASAEYRMVVAQNLLRRFALEHGEDAPERLRA